MFDRYAYSLYTNPRVFKGAGRRVSEDERGPRRRYARIGEVICTYINDFC